MKLLLTFLALACLSLGVEAEPRLLGRWISDREATMTFNKQHAVLQQKTVEFLTQITGRLTLTFTADDVVMQMPDWEYKVANESRKMVGFSEHHQYTVLASTDSSVAIRMAEPVTGSDQIHVYHFENPDKMWLYVSTLGMHIREYFTRVQ